MAESAGQAWEVFAVMDDGRLTRLVAKHPTRPLVIDITDELADLLAVKEADAQSE